MPSIPSYFEANRGQAAPEVKFIARGGGYTLLLTPREALVRIPAASSPVRMTFVGATADPQVIGRDQLPGKVNYFLGARTSWRTNIPIYAKVEYRELYRGIDLVYHADRHHLEYDFVVGAGADPRAIVLEFAGARTVEVTADGDLALHTDGGIMRHAKPITYQDIGGERRLVESRYVITQSRRVAFELGPYDATRPLVIDPTLVFSSYLGGSAGDSGQRVAVDAAGQIHFTGATGSLDFPIANAAPLPVGDPNNAFVVKVSADGSTLLYATYFGGAGVDDALDIGVDSSGGVYVCGMTGSADFPVHNAIQPVYGGGDTDAFVVSIDPAGDAFVYATYLGGAGFDRAATLAVDGLGHAYVAGATHSPDFPTTDAFQRRLRGQGDAFVTKLSPTGAREFSSYLARSFPTRQPFQRTLAGASDAFVTRLSADGRRILYSTFLGGSGPDTGMDLALDAAGRATVVGHTVSTDFPTLAALQPQLMASAPDTFVAQFEADGARLRFSTYLGGTGSEFPWSVAVDATGHVHIAGLTDSVDLPLAAPLQATSGGDYDAFVVKMAPDGSHLVYSTYLGGSNYDEGVGIAIDSSANAYVTGRTRSFDFPVVNALQPAHAGQVSPTFPGLDAFFLKITP
jgi:hypothetical protein